MSTETFKNNIKTQISNLETRSNAEVNPDKWVLHNKVNYPKWISNEYKRYSNEENMKAYTSQSTCSNKVSDQEFTLFPHQELIRDYLQIKSPYRGLLLYHGLGVGKTCSSIAVSEILLNFKKVIIILPAALKNNYVQELQKCGNNFFNIKKEWVFIEKSGKTHSEDLAKLYSAKYNKFISDNLVENNQVGLWIPHTEKYKSDKYDYISEEIVHTKYTKIDEDSKQSESTPKKICPEGTILNEKTNECVKKKICPEGKILNEKTNRCIKIKQNDGKTKNTTTKTTTKTTTTNDLNFDRLLDLIRIRRCFKNYKKEGSIYESINIPYHGTPEYNILQLLQTFIHLKKSLKDVDLKDEDFEGYTQLKQDLKYIPQLFESSNFWKDIKSLISYISKDAIKCQKDLQKQVDNIIQLNYEFINYDGLRNSNISKITKKGYFDNKLIIIDEMHNFMLGVSNSDYKDKEQKLLSKLYNCLMHSVNSKFVLLSGTPIINSPHEIAYSMNLLNGLITSHCIKSDETISKDDINNILKKNKYIDSYKISYSLKKTFINFQLIPIKFEKTKDKFIILKNNNKNKTHESMIQNVIKQLGKKKIKFERQANTRDFLLPTKVDEFTRFFVDKKEDVYKIQRKSIFLSRLSGLISFFSMDEKTNNLLPEKIGPIVEKVAFSDMQIMGYVTQRYKEIKLEFSQKQNKNKINDTGVYKIFSRLVSNFIFPFDIKRPEQADYKTTVETENDSENITDFNTLGTIDTTNTNSNKQKEKLYLEEINKQLKKLFKKKDELFGDVKYNLDDDKSSLFQYSPKYCRLLKNIHSVQNTPKDGKVLIYSNFRKVEGLGVLGIVLQANKYSEIKIQKCNNDTDFELYINDKKFNDNDLTTKEINNLKFIKYSGNDKSISNIVLSLYNNDLDALPNNIINSLSYLKLLNKTNKANGIIKILMITQSGSEGISLKAVRQVHIIEPYWNRARIDQVIGRAIRTCSHNELDKDKRNVTIYEYCTTFKSSYKITLTKSNSDENDDNEKIVKKIIETRFKMKIKEKTKSPQKKTKSLFIESTLKLQELENILLNDSELKDKINKIELDYQDEEMFKYVFEYDKKKTVDEQMRELSDRKSSIANDFITTLKESSIDCSIFKKLHPTIKCSSESVSSGFDYNVLSYQAKYKDDYDVTIEKTENIEYNIKKVTIKTKNNHSKIERTFIYHTNSEALYDFQIFETQERLEQVGFLYKQDNGKYKFRQFIK